MKTTFITNPLDLANYSSPIGHLFQQPKTAAEWEQYVLTNEQVSFFKENGYLSGIKILTEQQVDALNVELVRLQSGRREDKELFYHYESNESEDPDKVLFHAIGAWRVTPGFHDLIWAPAYRMAAYQLLGQPFRLFHDQLFCKPAKHGGVVAWHQDFSYWTFTKPMQHLTCWIGLDDANIDNGCLYYIPGSHKWGLLPITGLAGDMDAVTQILDADQMLAFEKKFANELSKGYASFHHPLMMHGSYANASERSRRAVVINSMGQDTMGNTAGYERLDALDHFPPMPQDQLLSSQFFPKLFPDKDDDIQRLINSVPTISSLD
jgi:ectoine hydroxylase-related dioxygenase (phytanoyl-CoA dioxygenase family)